MVSSHLTHDILCVGSHEPHQHDFHAANARAIADLFAGGLGPSRAFVECLAGPHVTVSAVSAALAAAVDRAATNLVVYFSGHGSSGGLRVSDDTIGADVLGRHLMDARAHAVLLILDLAIGADLDQALLPDWLRTLATNRAGLRVAVARATRIGAGAEGEGLARFTAALISALESASGDIRVDRRSFISDKLAMEQTRKLLDERWGLANFPIELGEFGDVPLTRSQASTPVGQGTIVNVTPGAGLSVSVSWTIEGRANLKTSLRYELVRIDDTVAAQGSVTLVPMNPLQKGKTHLRALKGQRARKVGAASLTWRISLCDARGRVLAEHRLDPT